MKVYKEGKCKKCGKIELMPPNKWKRNVWECKKCLADYQREFKNRSKEHYERSRFYVNRYQRGLRRSILEHYSGSIPAKCVQCSESRYVCLELDHINDDGAEHGKKLCK